MNSIYFKILIINMKNHVIDYYVYKWDLNLAFNLLKPSGNFTYDQV
jgi:hypothetical protein